MILQDVFTMFVAIVLSYLLFQVHGDDIVRYKCGEDGTKTSMTFTPAEDGVMGRYTVKLCTANNPNVTLWQLNLWYYYNLADCTSGRKPDGQHSVMKEQLTNPKNCTNVCYSVDFDLIFKACYNIQSALGINNRWLRPRDFYIPINNTVTKDIFTNNRPHVSFIPHEKMVTLHWYLGLPATFYEVLIDTVNNDSTELEKRVIATNQCSAVTWNEVKCRLVLPVGCYQASFHHLTTWTVAFEEQANVHFMFCLKRAQRAVVVSGASLAWWAGGGALAAGGALLAALAARRRARAPPPRAKTRLPALRCESEMPQPLVPRGRHVVLLYAREGERAQRAVDTLKALLQQATGAQVLDLFSAEVTAAAGGAPATWVRGVLLSDASRVLLLQTPALAALYSTRLHPHSLNLSSPLVGRRAMYRRPQFGDQLLLLALRLLAETPALHHDYSKCYLATYGALTTELVSAVVPFRRYVLPAGAATLLRHLAPDPPHALPSPDPLDPLDQPDPPDAPDLTPAELEHYSHAVADFVTHVQQNPDYLLDELIFM